MHQANLARSGRTAPGDVLDPLHADERVPTQPKAVSSPEARGTHHLHLNQPLVPAAHSVAGLAAEPDLAADLSDPEFWLGGDDDVSPREAHRRGHTVTRGASVSALMLGAGSDPAAEVGPWGAVVDCELADGLPQPPTVTADGMVLVLVRLFGEPIGMLMLTDAGPHPTSATLERAIVAELEAEIRERVEECGLVWSGQLPAEGLQPPRTPRFVAGRERALTDGPEITVAVCTRDRPAGVGQVIDSLRRQHYPRLRILIVDNAPSDDITRRLVDQLRDEVEIDYVREPRPGLSWARNRAIDASDSEVIAWADDDEVCDPWWATEIARAFVDVPEADAVTGMVAPAELHTRTQLWFERYSGVARGRGFRRTVFSPATASRQSPLYPLPPYGAGANMAFRRDAIERVGRFDPALGTGTATLAGEDTAALCTLLYMGGTVVYAPAAIVFHRHRRDEAALERVMLGYGRGLSAYYASMVARHPRCLPELVRLSRRAIRDQLSTQGQRQRELDGFPPELLRLNRRGLLQGAFLYPGARRKALRLAALPAGGIR